MLSKMALGRHGNHLMSDKHKPYIPPKYRKDDNGILRDYDRAKIHKAYEKELEWIDIDWSRIARAVEFYQSLGYKKIEVPWIVEPVFRKVTYPHDNAFETAKGDIIGSAEQAFLQLAFEDKIQTKNYHGGGYGSQKKVRAAGRYVAVTPCFRDNQPEDELHQLYFMKVELFEPVFYGAEVYTRGIKPSKLFLDAGKFFASEGAIPESEETDEGIDWTLGGIEIGSYGFRVFERFGWLYGTGLAEPRFSQALRQQDKHLCKKVPSIRNEIELEDDE